MHLYTDSTIQHIKYPRHRVPGLKMPLVGIPLYVYLIDNIYDRQARSILPIRLLAVRSVAFGRHRRAANAKKRISQHRILQGKFREALLASGAKIHRPCRIAGNERGQEGQNAAAAMAIPPSVRDATNVSFLF
jgi:hypothetical protein